MKAIDVEALAGAWDLGVVREGFEITHRVALPGGFGNEVIDANRDVLGEFEVETGDETTWTPQRDVSFVFGTPPCSGWSVMNTTKTASARGLNSAIHQCTWGLVRYAARCFGSDGKPGPEVVSFESVQQAFTQGRALMSAYLDALRTQTEQDYRLTHVKMSGSTVGAAQYRPRYFWVAHRVPFGVDVQVPRRAATYRDAIYDLRGLPLKRDLQRIRRQPTEYIVANSLRSPDNRVDWHVQLADPTRGTGAMELMLRVMEYVEWPQGESLITVVQRHLDELPPSMHRFAKGWGGPHRPRWDIPGRVIHGGAGGQFIHPDEPRFLTIRELARLMGYPDTWRFPEPGNKWRTSAWIGKNCPVQSGQWLARYVRESLAGRPGPLRGRPDPDRPLESVIDVTHAYKDPTRIVAA